MRYQNTKTGFVFDSKTEVKAEGWVCLNSLPIVSEEKDKKPKRQKRTVKK